MVRPGRRCAVDVLCIAAADSPVMAAIPHLAYKLMYIGTGGIRRVGTVEDDTMMLTDSNGEIMSTLVAITGVGKWKTLY